MLLRQPPEFFANNAVRIIADKAGNRYQVKYIPDDTVVSWPEKSTAELVTEALGPDAIIAGKDHPVYVALTCGVAI